MKKNLATPALLALFVPMLAGCGRAHGSRRAHTVNAPAVPPAASLNFDFPALRRTPRRRTPRTERRGSHARAQQLINAVVRVVYLNLTVADINEFRCRAPGALSQQPVLGDDGWYVELRVLRQRATTCRAQAARARGRLDRDVAHARDRSDPGPCPR